MMRRLWSTRSILFVALAVPLALAAGPALTADGDSVAYRAVPAGAPQPLPPVNFASREALETFVDGFVSGAVQANKTAGLTISVVKDGALFFSKGYGFADVDKGVRVSPDQTLFRPGSISKLFTWTAVMQLVEQGKLDLDADVNTYLTQFKVPATFEKPVTLRSILTHSAGFEDGALGYLFVRTDKELVPLHEALPAHVPARVRPPGGATDGLSSSYSNWSTALAGLIVANVSGQPFDDYIAAHILQPLGMTSSTFAEPLPAELDARMSKGYVVKQGRFAERGFEFIHNFGPAGGLSATANDMANFAIAHLQNGRFGDARILQEATAQQMHGRAFSPSPFVNGSALGFYEIHMNGHRLFGHGGDTVYFHSELILVPDANVGFFISVNTADGARIPAHFIRAFMDEYFPATLPPVAAPAGFAKRAQEYAGSYRTTRFSHTKIEKLMSLFQEIRVAPTDKDTLLVAGLLGETGQFAEVAPSTFRQVDSDLTITFTRNAKGAVDGLVGAFAFMPSTKLSWYDTSAFHFTLLGLSVLLFLVAIFSALLNWRADRTGAARARLARRNLGLLALLNLLFIVLMIAGFSGGLENLIFGLPGTIRAALALPLINIVLTAIAIGLAVTAWRQKFWRTGQRVWHTLGVAAAVAFLWVLNYWNLVGYKLG